MDDFLKKLDFPKNIDEVKQRFLEYERYDPFPLIPPALLNSADIYEYARVTGMVFPFNREKEQGKLKSSSYEIDFLGTVYYWEETDKKEYVKRTITRDESFTFKENSIIFVCPETLLHLPDYIALRFNLRIKHVHRGLLLGTGPLVDAGFAGQLFIPIHNLTSEDYIIKGGHGLIWVEFTKLSPHDYWLDKNAERGHYRNFPPGNRYLTPEIYLSKASEHGNLARSSIPIEIDSAARNSKDAIAEVKKIESDIKNFEVKINKRLAISGGIAILAMVIAIAAMLIPVYQLVGEVNKYVQESGMALGTLQKNLDEREKTFSELKKDVLELKTKIQESSSNQPKILMPSIAKKENKTKSE